MMDFENRTMEEKLKTARHIVKMFSIEGEYGVCIFSDEDLQKGIGVEDKILFDKMVAILKDAGEL